MLHVFLRHCFTSSASSGKGRPQGFDRRELLREFANHTASHDGIDITVFVDCFGHEGELASGGTELASGGTEVHFAEAEAFQRGWKIQSVSRGSESRAFISLLNHIQDLRLPPDDIIVILEDDYKVAAGWEQATKEGLELADYLTLYDHPDKYQAQYSSLVSRLWKTQSCHWRSTPSTTNSFACRVKTLEEDIDTQRQFSSYSDVTADHYRWLELWKQGRVLISSIPAYWSHEEEGMQCKV